METKLLWNGDFIHKLDGAIHDAHVVDRQSPLGEAEDPVEEELKVIQIRLFVQVILHNWMPSSFFLMKDDNWLI